MVTRTCLPPERGGAFLAFLGFSKKALDGSL
jgi:hypothetical protein